MFANQKTIRSYRVNVSFGTNPMCTENKIVNYANRLLSIFVPMLEHVLEFLAKKMVEQSIEFTKKKNS